MASSKKVENLSHKEADNSADSLENSDSNPLHNPATNTPKTFKHASLPRFELWLGFIYVVGCVIYIKYRGYVISKEDVRYMRKTKFVEGWIPNDIGLQDNHDPEWSFWKKYTLTWNTFYMVIAYIVLGRLVDFLMPDVRKLFILSFGLTALTLSMSPRLVVFFLGHTMIAYIGSLTRNRWVVWIVCLLQTATIFVDYDFYLLQISYFPGLENVIVQLCFSFLRFISFGVECCGNDDKVKDYGLMDLLVYNFYFPLFSGGPVMVFADFQDQINKPARSLTDQEWWNIFKNTIRYLVWFCYTEALLHFCFFAAYHKSSTVFSNLQANDYAVLAGYHLMFFQLKYIVFYGFPYVIAMFDRIEVPKPPACILSLYTFKDMWRYFDRGVHQIIIRHVYFPLGGSRFGLFWSTLGAFCAFSFAALWHGNSYKMYSWAFSSWLGISIETVVIGLSWRPWAIQYQNRLSGPMLRRICAVVAVFNHMMLSLSNIIFLAGFPKFWSYVDGIFIEGFPMVTLVVFGFFYFNIQLIMEVQRRYTMDFIYNKKYF